MSVRIRERFFLPIFIIFIAYEPGEYVRKIDKNCYKIANHQRKSHHIRARITFQYVYNTHTHTYIWCQFASFSWATHNRNIALFSVLTYSTLESTIWIYEVNIILFYFIPFFTIKIFIATQSLFTKWHGGMMMTTKTRSKFSPLTPKSFVWIRFWWW